MRTKYERYIHDLGAIIRANAIEYADEGADEFRSGIAFGYYDVLTIMLSQAQVFEIDPAEIGLEGLDPDRDILMRSSSPKGG